jgi:hypothetical protein
MHQAARLDNMNTEKDSMAYAAFYTSQLTQKNFQIPRNQSADILHRAPGIYNREKRITGVFAGDVGALHVQRRQA